MSDLPAVHARLAMLDTCALSDALERLSLGTGLGGFGRWGPLRRIVGRAVTAALAPGPASVDGPHLGTRALAAARPGDVIVVANSGRTDAACWGGLLTLEAHVRGLAGVILDGSLRDVDEVTNLDVPVVARGATPRSARGRFHEAATGVSVKIDGVSVEPGAWVVADGSGIVFVPAGIVAEVVATAEEIAAAERRMAAALLDGTPGTRILDARYERMLEDASE